MDFLNMTNGTQIHLFHIKDNQQRKFYLSNQGFKFFIYYIEECNLATNAKLKLTISKIMPARHWVIGCVYHCRNKQ